MKFNPETHKFELSMVELVKLLKEAIPYQVQMANEGKEMVENFFESEIGTKEDVLDQIVDNIWALTDNSNDPVAAGVLDDEYYEMNADELDAALDYTF